MEFRNHIGFALQINCKKNYDKYVETMVLAGYTRIYPFYHMLDNVVMWQTKLINGERYVHISITDYASFSRQYEFTQTEHDYVPTPFTNKG